MIDLVFGFAVGYLLSGKIDEKLCLSCGLIIGLVASMFTFGDLYLTVFLNITSIWLGINARIMQNS